jgi:excisionase family DNA binding protein
MARKTTMVRKTYTVDQAAEMLHVTPSTVREWIRRRKIRSFKLGDLVRIHEEELLAFIDSEQEKGQRGKVAGFRKSILEIKKNKDATGGEIALQVRNIPESQFPYIRKEVTRLAGDCPADFTHVRPDWIEVSLFCTQDIDEVLKRFLESGWFLEER